MRGLNTESRRSGRVTTGCVNYVRCVKCRAAVRLLSKLADQGRAGHQPRSGQGSLAGERHEYARRAWARLPSGRPSYASGVRAQRSPAHDRSAGLAGVVLPGPLHPGALLPRLGDGARTSTASSGACQAQGGQAASSRPPRGGSRRARGSDPRGESAPRSRSTLQDGRLIRTSDTGAGALSMSLAHHRRG